MKKTKDSIIYKWEKKKSELKWAESVKLSKKQNEIRLKYDRDLEYQLEKAEKKSQRNLEKKLLEYDRKCKNEIRQLEGKPQREYKKKVIPFKTVEFAMELAQENAKLRDTDADGRGFCISCDKLCEWWDLQWGHDHSRRVKNICIHKANINAQCRRCNLIMWPLGNVELKFQTEQAYRLNLIKKYGREVVDYLDQQKASYFQKWYESNWDYGQWKDSKGKVIPLDRWIEEAIKENELRWKGKSFYKPKKKWRKIREERKAN